MGKKIKGKIDGLVEGCEYRFRVRAVNKGGPGLPGPQSESMIAKHRFIPPFLKGGIYDITLKKGRPIRYDLWFGGEPAPTCEWIRNGRPLTANEDTSIELYSKNTVYTEKNTVLSIPKVFLKYCRNTELKPIAGGSCPRHRPIHHQTLVRGRYLRGHRQCECPGRALQATLSDA